MPFPCAEATCFLGACSPGYHARMEPSFEKASNCILPGTNSNFSTLAERVMDQKGIVDASEDHVKIRPSSPATARIFPLPDIAKQNMRFPGDCFLLGSSSLPIMLYRGLFVQGVLVFGSCKACQVLKTSRLKIRIAVSYNNKNKDLLCENRIPSYQMPTL